MTKLEEIEAAVEKLSRKELKQLRAWLDELEERLFDERIERDAKAGKLDALEAKALENLKAGRVKDL
jgi:mRNA-degrading endonuclease RelE of RelBE toxin-antitoxin system